MKASPRSHLALAAAVVAAASGLAAPGCYDVRRPVCGFYCGPGGACPESYACNALDNRCHLVGSSFAVACVGPDGMTDRAPVVVFTQPRSGEVGVAEDAVITVAFSRPVDNVTESTFVVEQNGVVLAGNVDFIPGDSVATFYADAPFTLDTSYRASLSNEIYDLRGFPLVPHTWRFTTRRDSAPPMVVETSPQAGQTGVSVFPQLYVFFSEPVIGVSHLTFTLHRGGDEAIPAGVDPVGPTSYLLTPQALAYGTEYTARLSPDITDLSGNALLGAPYAWSFTTAPDLTGPSVQLTFPADDTTGALARPIRVRFDDDVLGVSAATFTLDAGTGTVSYDPVMRTASFTPTALPAETTITATLTAGITDGALNALQGAPYTWSFTTGADTTRPEVVVASPGDGATGVPVAAAIEVAFSEPVKAVSSTAFVVRHGAVVIAGTRTGAAGDAVWTFTPTADLPAGATVTVELGSAITDLPGNPLVPHAYSFATAP